MLLRFTLFSCLLVSYGFLNWKNCSKVVLTSILYYLWCFKLLCYLYLDRYRFFTGQFGSKQLSEGVTLFWPLGESFLAKMTSKSPCLASSVLCEMCYYGNHCLWAFKVHNGMKTKRVMKKIMFRAIFTPFLSAGDSFLARITHKTNLFGFECFWWNVLLWKPLLMGF